MQNDHKARIRKGLSALYLPFYDKLCVSLPEDWQPYSGFRSFESQDAKYAQGRKKDSDGVWHDVNAGQIVTHAKAGESPHNYGCATDWTKWNWDGEPLWLKKEDPEWKSFIEVVVSLGLRSGAEFGDVDHAELRIAVPWTTISTVYKDRGLTGALAAIQVSMSGLS